MENREAARERAERGSDAPPAAVDIDVLPLEHIPEHHARKADIEVGPSQDAPIFAIGDDATPRRGNTPAPNMTASTQSLSSGRANLGTAISRPASSLSNHAEPRD